MIRVSWPVAILNVLILKKNGFFSLWVIIEIEMVLVPLNYPGFLKGISENPEPSTCYYLMWEKFTFISYSERNII